MARHLFGIDPKTETKLAKQTARAQLEGANWFLTTGYLENAAREECARRRSRKLIKRANMRRLVEILIPKRIYGYSLPDPG